MDRRIRDKRGAVDTQTPGPLEQHPQVQDGPCPYCGQTPTPSRCRQVPAGWFCWQYGLQDGSSNLLLQRAVTTAAIDNDPDVLKAEAKLATLQPEVDAVTADWERAVTAHRRAAHKRMRVHSVVSGDYGEMIEMAPQGTPCERQVEQLREMAAQAAMQREFVIDKQLKLKDQVDKAKARVRRRLAAA
jgi:hypothetical protein